MRAHFKTTSVLFYQFETKICLCKQHTGEIVYWTACSNLWFYCGLLSGQDTESRLENRCVCVYDAQQGCAPPCHHSVFGSFLLSFLHIFCWMPRKRRGARKQWNLPSFQRPCPCTLIKISGKVQAAVLCLLQPQPTMTRWALQSWCNQTD